MTRDVSALAWPPKLAPAIIRADLEAFQPRPFFIDCLNDYGQKER
jgi:hypothetical protein